MFTPPKYPQRCPSPRYPRIVQIPSYIVHAGLQIDQEYDLRGEAFEAVDCTVVDAGIDKIENGVFCNRLYEADGFEEVELREDGVAVGMFYQYGDVSIGDSLAVKGEDGFAQEGFEILGSSSHNLYDEAIPWLICLLPFSDLLKQCSFQFQL